jgi:energy-coupling factor transporter transmembrane protein EcfT
MARVDVINFMANVGRDSWFHRLDPRTKIAIIIFFSTIPLIFSDWRYISVCLLLALPLWLTSNIKFRPMAGPFTAVGTLLAFIFIFNAIRAPDELTGARADAWSDFTWYVQWGPIVLTSHSVLRALFLSLRLLAPLTIGILVIATTDPTYLAKGLRKLGLPVAAVFMVLAGLRFIPVVMEQLFNILDAMTIRGIGKSRIERTKLLILRRVSNGRSSSFSHFSLPHCAALRRWDWHVRARHSALGSGTISTRNSNWSGLTLPCS